MQFLQYSVIVPHKNSSHLLARLLDSIPLRTDVEIIVVDDNSTAEEYNRVRELQKIYPFSVYQNQGVFAGGARNTGLRHAVGKWVMFSDSDDFFTEYLSTALDKYGEYPHDAIFFNVTSCISETGERAYRDRHIKKIAKSFRETGDEDYLRCCYTAPWGKLYKRDFLIKKNILFDEVIAGNDMMFSVKCGLAARTITYDHHEISCITVSSGSITTTLSKDRFESRFMVTLAVNDLLRKNNKESFQISILYFIAKAHQFGFIYMLHVIRECVKHHSNLFIGAKKIMSVREVLQDRQNKPFLVEK